MKPRMPKAEALLPYLSQIDETGIYSNFGPLHALLCQRLAVYFGVDEDCIVLISNATLGLQGSLTVLASNSFEPNVVLPSWTFTASASASLLTGFNVEFADIDNYWRLQADDGDEFVLDVLPFGEGLRNSENSHLNAKFQVIDGAASFDSLHGAGRNLQENSVLVVSLHATKLLGAGEGGVCITSSPEIAKELKAWSNFGFQGTRESKFLGTNSKMSEYNAAVGLASLDMWEETRSMLQRHLSIALEISDSCGVFPISSMVKNFVSPYWIVNFESPSARNAARDRLNKRGIETRTWWGDGCHKMAAYASIPRRELPNTELAAATSLGLPFHTYLTDSDYESIAKALAD